MKMKRWISLALSGAMVLSLLTGVGSAAPETESAAAAPTSAAAAAFPDVEGHWAAGSIARWAEAGIVRGNELGNYEPDRAMTRAEFATVLNNLMGYTEKGANAFADVSANDWFADAVLKLAAAGVMKGDGVNANPTAPITRQEAFVMLCRVLKLEGKEKAATGFADDAEVADWAKGAVAVLAEMGIANGVGGNKFAPLVDIDRASMAALLDKAVKVYANKDGQEITGKVDGIVILAAKNVVFNKADVSAMILLAPAMGDGAKITLTGSTKLEELTADRNGMSVVVEKGSKLEKLTLAGKDATLTVGGTVAKVIAQGDNASITVEKSGKITTLTANSAVKVRNNGSIDTLEANAGGIIVDGNVPRDVKVAKGVAMPTDSKGTPLNRKTSSGGGGGGGGSSSRGTPITNVYILVNDTYVYTLSGDTKVVKANVGDTLSAAVTPSSATYTSSWLVGGAEKSTEKTYTVDAMDVGQTVAVTVTGTGSYTGTKTSDATAPVKVVTNSSDIYALDPDTEITAPVVLTDKENTYFADADGEPIEIPGDAELVLSVEKQSAAKPGSTDAGRIEVGITGQVKDADGNPVAGVTVPDDAVTVAVDVELTMTVTDEEGEVTETPVHPVGETVVTLTRENLGLAADADLSLYVFAASHVNAVGETQSVEGKVVEVNGQDCVRFTLNGLSRIWIGNVPPRTVKFDTDGGTEIESQKVKFGSYAIRPVKNPTKEGWLFAGWDHDLETENIIKDITVKALWVKGTPAADSQLTGVWTVNGQTPDAAPAEAEMANGEVIITLDSKGEYPAGAAYTLTVSAPAGAVKAYVSTTAEGAMASTTAAAQPVTLTAQVTDADGAVKLSNQAIYVKWTDADGKLVDLQSARLVVKTELNAPADVDTKTRTETLEVNRGIGTYEVYLTGGKSKAGKAIEDYVGTINAYLTRNGEEWVLEPYASMSSSFSVKMTDADGFVSYEDIRSDNYTTVKVVITPFEGESFTALPTVDAWYWDYSGEKREERTWDLSAKLDNGKIVLTGDLIAGEESSDLYVTLTLNGVSQEITIWPGSWTESSNSSTSVQAETWDEVVAAIAAHEHEYIYYLGKDDVTLTTAITLDVDQDLIFRNAGLTIGKGGSVTLKGTYGDAARLQINNGSLTIAEGGKIIVPAQPETVSSHLVCTVQAYQGNITVEKGGAIEVAENGFLHVTAGYGTIIAEGGSLNCAGTFRVYRNDNEKGKNVVAGTVTATGRSVVGFNDGLTVTATGHIDIVSGLSNPFKVYGGLTVEEGGVVDINATYKYIDRSPALLSGRTVNAGTINLKAGILQLSNTGFSVANMGTINIAAGASLDVAGTVLVNTGTVAGEGTVTTWEFEDMTDYDNHNGIEWVEQEGADRTPADYARYKFTYDPAGTVEAIYYLGELSNQDGGTCTATVTALE